jgi:predicted dehydrogenase
VEAVRWGIISTARINSKIVRAAAGSGLVEVAGIASRQLERAQAAARSLGLQRAYGSYEALLADEEIEAVYISLPNSLHFEWSARALEAGKHVLCEKPLSRHPGEVEALFDKAQEGALILSEAFMYRHHPQTRRLSQLIEQGAIGELRLVRAAFSFTLTDPRNIRLRPELDGGALLDVGCYCLSAARLLAGEPLSAHAEAWFGPSGTDWVCAGTLRFPGDVLAVFDCGTALPPRDELEAIGSEGSLFLDDPWRGIEARIEYRHAGANEVITVEPADPYRLELENLSAAIRGRDAPLLGRDDALGQARALDALMRSARTGARVSL